MKTHLVIILAVAIQSLAYAAPVRGGVPGLSIPNAHELTSSKQKGRVMRGSQPNSKVSELSEIGVTDVLIFKNDVRGEVASEAAVLKKMGITVHKIPFQWKDIDDTEAACEQVIEAEILLEKIAQKKGKSIFFHCTAGEDRTGLLAGIFRISNQGWSVEDAFKKEMCKNGFADGNKNKPAPVAATVRSELYPVYVMAAAAIHTAQEKGVELSKKFCNKASISTLKNNPKCR